MSSAPWYLNSEKPVSYMLLFVCIVFSVAYCNEKAVYLYDFFYGILEFETSKEMEVGSKLH